MLKKALLLATLLLAGAGLAAAWFLWGGAHVIELSQREVQTALETGFPVEKTYLHLIQVTLSDPGVTLPESSERISFSVKIGIGWQGRSKPLRGTAELSCRIRYEPSRGTFYCDDPEVERLTVDGHPEGFLERTKGGVTWVLKGVLEHTPVYTLRAGDVRHSLAKLILKEVRVRNGKLRLTLGMEK